MRVFLQFVIKKYQQKAHLQKCELIVYNLNMRCIPKVNLKI